MLLGLLRKQSFWLLLHDPMLAITFCAVWARGPNAPIPAVGHAWTVTGTALELHRQHRCFPVSLQEMTLLTGAGIWREKARDIYVLVRLKSLLTHLIKPHLITYATKSKLILAWLPILLLKKSFLQKEMAASTGKSNNINRRLKINLVVEVRMQNQ